MTSLSTTALDDEFGVDCCECTPEISSCCTVECDEFVCNFDPPACCFFVGQAGVCTFSFPLHPDNQCCTQATPPCQPQDCTPTSYLPYSNSWGMRCIACDSGFGYALFTSDGTGQFECNFPFWFTGSWKQLNPLGTCGFCIPCPFGGTNSDPIVGHCFPEINTPCQCFALTGHVCCPGQNDFEVCPDIDILSFEQSCEGFAILCARTERICSGFPNCVGTCIFNLPGTLVEFMVSPLPCRLCLESVFGTVVCYTDGIVYDTFCPPTVPVQGVDPEEEITNDPRIIPPGGGGVQPGLPSPPDAG